MITAIRKRLEEKEEGFTLIELLVVVIIIGILAAIAIPVFLNQRERAWERAAMSDLRNASVVMEEVFSITGSYVGANAGSPYTAGGNVITVGTPPQELRLTISDNVSLTAAGTESAYVLSSTHSNLPGRTWRLDSTVGRVVEAAPAG